MPTDTQPSDRVRGILEHLEPHHLVLHVPHTDYHLRLALTVPKRSVKTPPGKRITGTITAKALRIHGACGGGRFIEPLTGEPRIVAGTVKAVDAEAGRVLVDVSVPMWLETEPGQDYGELQVGALVSCYVASGAAFTPQRS